MNHDVFISYSTTDQKVVEGLSAYLEQHGIRCFIAYRDIPRGVVWAKAITEAIDESRMMVVVFSESFNTSDQVDREIELCAEAKKPILTFRIAKTDFSGAKKYYLKNLNWIDAFPNPEKYFGALLQSVQKLLGKENQVSKPQQISVIEQERLKTETEKPKPDKHVNKKTWLWILLTLIVLGGIVFIVKYAEYVRRQDQITIERNMFFNCKDVEDYRKYLNIYPLGLYNLEAENIVQEFVDDSTKVAFKNIINQYGMIFVEGGTFAMGTTEAHPLDSKPSHIVKLSDYYIGKYEVTIAQFRKFIEETNYRTDAEKQGKSYIYNNDDRMFKNGVTWQCDENGFLRNDRDNNYPVSYVSWNDAVAFCEWLSRETQLHFRLPTEAEWEFAARGGNRSNGYKYSGSNNLDAVGWIFDISGNRNMDKTHPVGQKLPNELGIYDMSGNIEEWCQDWYGDYSSSNQTNPLGASFGSRRVRRGGNFRAAEDYALVYWRKDHNPDFNSYSIGFRLALDQ